MLAPRSSVVSFHRYLGLALTGFLVVVGLTGSVMVFQSELDRWLNPDLFDIAEVELITLPIGKLVEKIEQAEPSALVTHVPIVERASSAIVVYVEAKIDEQSGHPFDLSYDELFVNPVTGDIVGRRMWGECCLQRPNLMPFIFKIHNRLLLPKPWGSRIMGLVAFCWLVMALLGIYLTMPKNKPFWRGWKRAWKIRRGGSTTALLSQVHKSFGLWIWVVMLSSSVTALTLSLESELFRPFIGTLSPITKSALELYRESTTEDNSSVHIPYGDAMHKAKGYAKKAGLLQPASSISYRPSDNVFVVEFSDKGSTGLGPIKIFVTGKAGEFIGTSRPDAESFSDWLLSVRYPLHSGKIAGFYGRVILSITGIILAIIAVSGSILWSRKYLRTRKYHLR